jgi:hypothetical protein
MPDEDNNHFYVHPDGGVTNDPVAAGAVPAPKTEEVKETAGEEGEKATETAADEPKQEEAGEEAAEEEKTAEDVEPAKEEASPEKEEDAEKPEE